ncbi:hypothetical protein HII16_07340 [Thalassotalea sp. Y01]|nr:hypothetical protein [Thalassotalea sp. Y01]
MSKHIAMWSGPRNISTAMMRSFENRSDTCVVDEPFYGYYLAQTGLEHPMAAEVMADQANDWQTVASQMAADFAEPVCYQKMMTHHMLDNVDFQWCKDFSHCFLIRDPRYVINSYIKKMPTVNNEDIGIIKQHQLYKQISDISGQQIPIIDSKDVLLNPRGMLKALCQQLQIDFEENMLNWPKGRRDSDGVWASHWYHNVESSTGFAKFSEPDLQLNEQHLLLAKENMPYYHDLYSKRLQPVDD